MSRYEEASSRTRIRISRTYKDEYVSVQRSEFLARQNYKGLGLYANKKYKAGDVILEYIGKKLTNDEANQKRSHKNYLFDVKQNKKVIFVLDGANNKYSSAAKFVNSTLSFTDKKRNAEFVQRNQKIYLIASRPISKGKEIISFYGEHALDIIDNN
jgi:SET domain-containing protein